MVWTSLITVPSSVELGHRLPPGGENVGRFGSSVMRLNDEVCERHFAIIPLEF